MRKPPFYQSAGRARCPRRAIESNPLPTLSVRRPPANAAGRDAQPYLSKPERAAFGLIADEGDEN